MDVKTCQYCGETLDVCLAFPCDARQQANANARARGYADAEDAAEATRRGAYVSEHAAELEADGYTDALHGRAPRLDYAPYLTGYDKGMTARAAELAAYAEARQRAEAGPTDGASAAILRFMETNANARAEYWRGYQDGRNGGRTRTRTALYMLGYAYGADVTARLSEAHTGAHTGAHTEDTAEASAFAPYFSRIYAAGYGGVAIWRGWNDGQYMGCLMALDETTPLYDANLYEYVHAPEAVIRALTEYAERNPRADGG